jgi:hypothetical protein
MDDTADRTEHRLFKSVMPPPRKAFHAQKTFIDSRLTFFESGRVEGSSNPSCERTKREHGRRFDRAAAVAAPATVSGERSAEIDHWVTGKVRQGAETREPGDLPSTVLGLTLERGCSGIHGLVLTGRSESFDTRSRSICFGGKYA